jgi:hypothetical protein
LEGGVFLSKRRFILFALVAALVLSFAGSAMADNLIFWGENNTGTGKWSDDDAWKNETAPSAAKRVPLATDTVEIPTGSNVTIDSAAVAESITFAEPPRPGELGQPSTVTLTGTATLTVGNTTGSAADTWITANHDATITGGAANKIVIKEDTTTVTTNISVAEDNVLNVGVLIESDAGATSLTTLAKTDEGELALSGGTGGGLINISHVAAGTLTVTKAIKPNGTITLAASEPKNVLNLGGEQTLATGSANTTITPDGNNESVINILGGAEITLGNGALAASVGTGKINVEGKLILGNASLAANIGSATINVTKNGTLEVEVDSLSVATLNAEGKVLLNTTTSDKFTVTEGSKITGSITGVGILVLKPDVDEVIELRGSSSYGATEIDGTAAGIVEILNARSLSGPVTFTGGDDAILRVAADASDFTLSNNILTNPNAGTINVPAGKKLTLSGSLSTATSKPLYKAGGGELVLAGIAGSSVAGGVEVNAGTLTLAKDNAIGATPITLAGNMTALKAGFAGVTHGGDLTVDGAQARLTAPLTEANRSEPLLVVDGAFTGAGSLIVETAYPGTWAKEIALQVVEYRTAGSTVPTISVWDADNNPLPVEIKAPVGATATTATLTAIPTKDCVFPVIVTASDTVKSADKTFDLVVTVTSETGVDQTATKARFVKSGLGDLVARVGNGIVTISGAIPADDGTYYIELIATAEGGYASKAEDIKLVVRSDGSVNPDGPEEEEGPNVKETTKLTLNVVDQTLKGKITYTFNGVATAANAKLKLIEVDGDKETVIDESNEPISASGFEIDLGNEDLQEKVAGFEFEYLPTSYKLEVEIQDVTDAKNPWTITFNGGAKPGEKEPGNGGGGCDAGFGLFGLLAATGAVALLRRKG